MNHPLTKLGMTLSALAMLTACGGDENKAPVASTQSVTVTENIATNISLSGTDADGDALTYIIVSQPTNGTLSGTAPNLTYTPNMHFSGDDAFSFRVNDGATDSADATVTISVSANEGVVYGPHNTGSMQAPSTVYFDLETMQALSIDEAAAETNTQWDVAFRRTAVMLNKSQSTPVGIYAMDNNAEFRDAAGAAVANQFVNATAETELAEYLAVTATDIPADVAMFVSDGEEAVIGTNFYNYDRNTHVVTPADNNYFVVQSDDNYARIRATNIVTAGRAMGEITLGIAFQDALSGQQAFGNEVALAIDATGCSDNIYVDFDTQTTVSATDAWDLQLTCSNGAAEFALDLAADAQVFADTMNTTGISAQNARFMPFTAANRPTYGISHAHDWYAYNLQGGHQLYSQYTVYIVSTDTGHFKLQLTSYYDENGNSGNISFRADKL